MSIYSTVIHAIENMKVIQIHYKGALRVVEPHLVGRNVKGNICLSAFQIAGGSGNGFRLFVLDQIAAAEATGDGFDGPRPGYNRNDLTMVDVIARL